VVAPAGDDGKQMAVAYPAAVEQVLAVAAHGCNLTALRTHSNKGSKPDILAPGQHIAVPLVRNDT